MANGAIKKIDIMIKLDKKVLERLSNPLFCSFSLFFFFKFFAVSKKRCKFFSNNYFFSHNYIATTSLTSGK